MVGRLIYIYTFLLCLVCVLPAQEREVKFKIMQTSDIHDSYSPYNFITQQEWSGSLTHMYTLMQKNWEIYKENLILLGNGDILQGQPSAYYYNYIDTVTPHVCAEMMDFMGYDAGNMGDHDVETGHPIFDRWVGECNLPVLRANIIKTATGRTHLPPYQVLERGGVKIVILDMIMPAIPAWLSEDLWQGSRFNDMEETARKWMKVIREKGEPDLVIGLFHAGQDVFVMSSRYNENASLNVAKNVPGFDMVLMEHDHAKECKKIMNVAGDSVLVIGPASSGVVVSDIDVTLKLKDDRVVSKQIDGVLTDTKEYGVGEASMRHLTVQYGVVEEFVSKKIGVFTKDLSTHPAYFGSSIFIDFIHSLQLDISGAGISFTAPLSFDAEIKEGDVRVSDMFNLYKYENMLYVMKLSGKEIKDFLEESYYTWTNQMKSPEGHLLWLREKRGTGAEGRASFRNFSFNFDSTAGIIYTVNVTKLKGEKMTIVSMTDGSPFRVGYIYKVTLNSCHGNGGRELLTKGVGISQEKLKERIIFSTNRDLCFYLMQYTGKKGTLNPRALNQWKFIPEGWMEPAAEKDYGYLFGTKQQNTAKELALIPGSKEEQYLSLSPRVKALIGGEEDPVANLASVAAVLREAFDSFWVDFYLVRQDQLVLGPFQGPVACTRIRKGKGICGTAWEEAKTQLVPDVEAFPRHIAYSSLFRSGIVVPPVKEDRVWGVLDIDSDLLNPFDETDRKYLEKMCRYL